MALGTLFSFQLQQRDQLAKLKTHKIDEEAYHKEQIQELGEALAKHMEALRNTEKKWM